MKKFIALVLALMLALPAGLALAEEENTDPIVIAPNPTGEDAADFAEKMKDAIEKAGDAVIIRIIGVRDDVQSLIEEIVVPECWDDLLLPETVGELAANGQAAAEELILALMDKANGWIDEAAGKIQEELVNQWWDKIVMIITYPVPEEIAEIPLPETVGDAVQEVKIQAMVQVLFAADNLNTRIDQTLEEAADALTAETVQKFIDLYVVELPEEIRAIAFAEIGIAVSLMDEPVAIALTLGLPDSLIEVLPETVGELFDAAKDLALTQILEKGIQGLEQLGEAGDLLQDVVVKTADQICDAIDTLNVPEEIAEIELPETVGEMIDELKGKATTQVTKEAYAVWKQIGEAAEDAKAAVTDAGITVITTVKNLPIPEEIADIPLPESVGALADHLVDTAESMVITVGNGAIDAVENAVETAKDLVDQTVEKTNNKVKDAFDKIF